MSHTHLSFSCPNCAKTFRWKQAIAGRKVLCTGCGVKVRIPSKAGEPAELLEASPAPTPAAVSSQPADGPAQGGYELLLDEPPSRAAPSLPNAEGPARPVPAVNGKCPSCNTRLKPGAVICLNCGFDLNAGRKIQTTLERSQDDVRSKSKSKSDMGGNASANPGTSSGGAGSMRAAMALGGPRSKVAQALEDREDDIQANRFVELWLPLGLIILGVGFNLVQALYFHQSNSMRFAGARMSGPSAMHALAVAALSVGVYVLVQIPLLLFAMILSVKLLGLAFGTLGRTLFKLVAVVLGPAAIGGIVAYLLGGGIVGFFVGDFFVAFVLFWVLVTVLFDLEAMEALYLIFLLWGVKWIAVILALAIGSSVLI